MYPVTNEFKLAAKQPVQEHRLYGTIGSVSFDKSNIIQGSFHITNQCTDTNDVVLGSVYTGTLTATFTGLSIPRYAWIGKRITVYFGLKVTPTTWEDIPMGTFTVKEAKHSAEGVSVTAYDDMIKLDKKFKKSKFVEPAKIFNYLRIICNTCGLILEDSEETIQSRPNGNTLLGIVGTKSNSKLAKYANDIETYRDLVFWIAQSMACFATINKLGHLMFVPYRNESAVCDEITEEHRIAGAVFDDFTTNYTGIYVTNTADGEEIYYGYDEQELEQEISDVEGDIHDVEIQLDQLAYQYQQGQITEAEYKRQKKVLDKQLKNLDKRLLWLNEALDKARLEEDGLYMDLGENPMMQADGVGNTPTTMRKRILKALDAISYTPFTCDTVCGAHYDLGDIIRFTGGHATELGEVCCVMAYDFNMNGEYRMQGFGSDPSKGVMKSKNSKKADKANRNADSSAKNTTGANLPETGNDGDLFIQTGGNISDEVLQMEYSRTDSTSSHPISINNFSGDNDSGFNFIVNGNPGSHDGERIYFDLQGLEEGGQYHVEFDAQLTRADGGWEPGQWNDAMQFGDTAINGIKDFNEHHYSTDFTYSSANKDLHFYYSLRDNYNFTYEYRNMVFTSGNTGVNSVSYYSETNNQWNNIDFVKEINQVQTSTGGEKIATAKNSDGTDTDIYAKKIEANPSGSGSTDLTKLQIGSTIYNLATGGGNDVGLSVGSNGAIQSTYTDGTEQTEDILRDDTGSDIVTLLNSIAIALQSAAINVESVNVNYSTTEQVIGTWIDGKPIYQITVETNLSNGLIYSVTNGKTVLIKEAYGVHTESSYKQYLNLNYFASNSDKCNVYTKGADVYTETASGFYSYYSKILFTIRYTKTTD